MMKNMCGISAGLAALDFWGDSFSQPSIRFAHYGLGFKTAEPSALIKLQSLVFQFI
jgi:hypothetical protein